MKMKRRLEMTRLIDADKLELDAEWDDYYDGFMSYSQSQISAAPTVEAEPVRHGRWIENATYEDGTKSYICDCCYADESWLDRLICRKEPYCPNCGAKMDSKEVAENEVD